MGVVYAAHDERLERPVALKMIREASTDDKARERLWREARAAASVSHPNICQLFEIAEEDGELFIAMELLEGESLAERLGRGPLKVAEAAQTASRCSRRSRRCTAASWCIETSSPRTCS